MTDHNNIDAEEESLYDYNPTDARFREPANSSNESDDSVRMMFVEGGESLMLHDVTDSEATLKYTPP